MEVKIPQNSATQNPNSKGRTHPKLLSLTGLLQAHQLHKRDQRGYCTTLLLLHCDSTFFTGFPAPGLF